MLIVCKKCEVKNEVFEILDLKEIEYFSERFLLIGKCRSCGVDIAQLIEIRNSDKKVFVNNFYGESAKRIIKIEKKRTKIKSNIENKFYGFVYGVNKEIKNRKGEVTQIRQYASDLATDNKFLIKTVFYKT